MVTDQAAAEWRWGNSAKSGKRRCIHCPLTSPTQVITMSTDADTKSQWDFFITNFPALYEMLHRESERGSVIVGAAVMDEALELLLKKRLVASPEISDELFKGPYAPLSDFAAKIDFAYRVGLIGRNHRSSLHLIRKLRNDFAHSSMQLNFESQKVHSRIQELFKLNKSLLDTIWDIVKKDDNPEVKEIIGNYESQHGVDYLSKFLGWRSTFELLGAMIAAALNSFNEDIEPLTARDAKKTS